MVKRQDILQILEHSGYEEASPGVYQLDSLNYRLQCRSLPRDCFALFRFNLKTRQYTGPVCLVLSKVATKQAARKLLRPRTFPRQTTCTNCYQGNSVLQCESTECIEEFCRDCVEQRAYTVGPGNPKGKTRFVDCNCGRTKFL